MKPENDALTPTRCDATLGGSASLEGCSDQALTEKMEAGESSKKGRGEYVIDKNIVDELHKFAIKQKKVSKDTSLTLTIFQSWSKLDVSWQMRDLAEIS